MAEDGTGRSTFELDGFSLTVRGPESFKRELLIEYALLREVVRWGRPRDELGGASPKIKNFMNAPMRSTTESCPTNRPCVNERLEK